jgi:hypothetical protein
LTLAAAQPEGDVLEDVEVREQRVALEDRVDRPLVGLGVGDVVLAEVIVPEVGSSSPATIRSVVVLPQPDGPSSAKNEPCGR